jgi:hypothetical protein
MGSGASAENARTTVANLLTGKPADASDIKVLSRILHILRPSVMTLVGSLGSRASQSLN